MKFRTLKKSSKRKISFILSSEVCFRDALDCARKILSSAEGASGRLHLQCWKQYHSRFFESEHPLEQIFIQTNKTLMMIPLKCLINLFVHSSFFKSRIHESKGLRAINVFYVLLNLLSSIWPNEHILSISLPWKDNVSFFLAACDEVVLYDFPVVKFGLWNMHSKKNPKSMQLFSLPTEIMGHSSASAVSLSTPPLNSTGFLLFSHLPYSFTSGVVQRYQVSLSLI